MIVVMFLSMIIQNMLQSRFEKYSRVRTNSGMTGAEIARKMLPRMVKARTCRRRWIGPNAQKRASP